MSTSARRRAAVASVVVTAALAGCDGGDPDHDDGVRDAIDTWRDARVAGDGKRFCAVLTRRAQMDQRRAHPRAKNCAEALRISQQDDPESLGRERAALRPAGIVDVHISGHRANGALTSGPLRLEFKLEKVGGKWLVSAVELPPGRAN